MATSSLPIAAPAALVRSALRVTVRSTPPVARVGRWVAQALAEQQAVARRNALIANTDLAERRNEREDAQRYLAQHRAVRLSGPVPARIPEEAHPPPSPAELRDAGS